MRPFRYAQRRSFLHSLNPSIKLLAVALVTIAITFVLDIYTPLVFLCASLLTLLLLGRLPLGYIARSMAPFTIFALSFVVINSLFHRELEQVTPVFTVGPLTVSWEGVALGLSVGLRVLFIVSTSLLFIATTKPNDFVLSLVQQARPRPGRALRLHRQSQGAAPRCRAPPRRSDSPFRAYGRGDGQPCLRGLPHPYIPQAPSRHS
jgi:energy-coupling factor transport system permease protein